MTILWVCTTAVVELQRSLVPQGSPDPCQEVLLYFSGRGSNGQCMLATPIISQYIFFLLPPCNQPAIQALPSSPRPLGHISSRETPLATTHRAKILTVLMKLANKLYQRQLSFTGPRFTAWGVTRRQKHLGGAKLASTANFHVTWPGIRWREIMAGK